MSDNLTTAQLLSHLKGCEECGYYVGAPVMCKGQTDGSKKGFWYEKCLNNAQPTPDSCNFFGWRPDIQRGKLTGGKKTPCPGFLCRQGKPNSSNVECTFGVCVRCCRHLQARLKIVRSCSISDHRKGVVYPAAELHESKEDMATHRRGRGRPKKRQAPESITTQKSTIEREGEGHSKVVTPSRAPPKHKSHATPTGPLYQARMSALDAEHRLAVEHQAERARQDSANAFLHKVTLRWWSTNGAKAESAELFVDNPSAFHPKDHPHLVDRYHCDTQIFQYYDSKKRVWHTGSRFSAARDLKKLSDDDLCYRSEGVTSGEGMPGVSKKRPPPEEPLADDTPRRHLPSFAQFPNTPQSISRHADSPAPTDPPASGSSAFSEGTDVDPFFNAFDFDFTPPTFNKGARTFAGINDTEPRLPALFPADPDITQSPTSSFTTPPIQPSPDIDLDSAPRGRGSNPWPWRYVCDMAAGFAAIRRLEDANPPMTTRDAFQDVFKVEFKSTTYGDQWRAWRAAGLVAGERDCWIQYGRTEPGEWLTFMRSWCQRC
uniref:Mannitol 1-phosphate dehydrogenase n=1 Tax=Ganoderma boninense TaxID=34458 RepID=A0A5K1K574_9APHY|nr:Mannitol 1-phosphate dehydrogenase [Ganoderma boninense]